VSASTRADPYFWYCAQCEKGMLKVVDPKCKQLAEIVPIAAVA